MDHPTSAAVRASLAEASAVEVVLAGAEIRLVGLEGMISFECELGVGGWGAGMIGVGWKGVGMR